MPERTNYTPAQWEAEMRRLVEETIPRDEKNKLDSMMAPCFVSASLDRKTLTLKYDNQPWMGNPIGNMHGGIISSAFDITMGSLCIGVCGFIAMTPTVSMQISYLRPVPAGESLVIEACVDHLGKSLLQGSARAWLTSAPEHLVATASLTYFIVHEHSQQEKG